MKNKILPLVLSFAFVLSGCVSENESTAEIYESEATQSKTETTSITEETAFETEAVQTTAEETLIMMEEKETYAIHGLDEAYISNCGVNSYSLNKNAVISEVQCFIFNLEAESEYTNVCDENEIAEYKDDISPIIDAKKLITYDTFMNVAKETLIMMEEKETYAIHGLEGVYISTCGVNTYSLNKNAVISEMQCFIFNSELEQVGVLYFHKDSYREYNGTWSICDSTIGEDEGKSILLQKLSENKDKKYVLLTYGEQGLQSVILDEDNTATHIGAVNSESDIKVIGNPYSIFNEKGLTVSYNDIVDENNLIWIDMNDN